MMQILATKLFVPPSRPKIVPRPRLLERLNAGLASRLTLICAPAGFGKTTLAASWISGCPQPAAWLSLDEGDNDLQQFLTYFTAALRGIVDNSAVPIGDGALTALQSPQPPTVESILILLINDIAAASQPFTLVLDDYHLIHDPQIDQALTFLLDHLPPNMQLVISSREDPLLPLSRLRAQGHLSELRASDLRFTSQEAAQFLNDVMGLNLTPAEISSLERRTEGWIAGLQLAAVTMQGREDKAGLIDAFTGSHRFVLDYLIEEVLQQQPPQIQDFLLQTAILSKMTGSLCDALTGQENGQATLENLERANLFVVSLDGERRWYRYHHLFGDLLRRRLRQSGSAQLPALYLKASAWYRNNGYSAEAIDYAIHGRDFSQAGHLIAQYVDDIWQLGEPVQLKSWLASLPGEVIAADPFLCLLQASNLYIAGQVDQAEHYLQTAEKSLQASASWQADRGPVQPDLSALLGRAATIRAHILSFRGQEQASIQWAHRALENLPKTDANWRWSAFDCLGTVYNGLDVSLAYQARMEALAASKAAGNVYLILLASLRLVVTLRDLGHLQQAADICRQQMAMAKENGLSQTALAGWLNALWGEILAEQNELDRALQLADEGVLLTERGADLILRGSSYLCLLRVLFSRSEFDQASERIQQINFAPDQDLSTWIVTQAAAWQARIWLAQNRLDEAAQWADHLGLQAGADLQRVHDFDYAVLARILIAQEQFEQARGLLDQLVRAADSGGRTAKLIELRMLQALNYHGQEQIDRALVVLRQALALAQSGGFVRLFLDEGESMSRLLEQARRRGVCPDYCSHLLAAFPEAEDEGVAPALDQSHLMEPLSDRELEVLQVVAQGLSNREIAARLYLSLNTVKVHTRNIYGKLGVHSRTKAILKARELGLLPPPQ